MSEVAKYELIISDDVIILYDVVIDVTEDGNMRVMMGKSACDDAVRDIEKDLKNIKRDTECQTQVGKVVDDIILVFYFQLNNDDKIVTLKEGTETAVEQCDDIHEKYVPNHVCMDQDVDYSGYGRIPTHGPHRPNWASFGEYRSV